MKKTIVILVLFFLPQVCLAQAETGSAQPASPEAVKTAESVPAPKEVGPDSEHEVEFYIETNKKLYRQGENIYLRFWIKNNSGRDIRTFYKDALIDFFTEGRRRVYGVQEIRDFIVDKSGFPRYIVLSIPTDRRKSTGDSLRQVIIRPGFYLTGRFNIIIICGYYWRSNVATIEVWNEDNPPSTEALEEEGPVLSGEEFLAEKPEGSPFVVEPF